MTLFYSILFYSYLKPKTMLRIALFPISYYRWGSPCKIDALAFFSCILLYNENLTLANQSVATSLIKLIFRCLLRNGGKMRNSSRILVSFYIIITVRTKGFSSQKSKNTWRLQEHHFFLSFRDSTRQPPASQRRQAISWQSIGEYSKRKPTGSLALKPIKVKKNKMMNN